MPYSSGNLEFGIINFVWFVNMAIIWLQSLKRKDRELEHEMERLAKEKVAQQKRILILKRELNQQFGHDVVLADPELPGTGGIRERCKFYLNICKIFDNRLDRSVGIE